MTYSLNELAALLVKAVTGAGLPMGHAVALSTAGVWLARRGVPICDLMARAIEGGMRESIVERAGDRVTFRQARAAIDSVAAIDLLLAGPPGDAVEMRDLDEPALLIGLAGVAAETHAVMFEINHDGGSVIVKPGVATSALRLGVIKPGTVTMVLSGVLTARALPDVAVTRYDPATVGDTGWQKLTVLAHKTYVPASEQSRISGAGAGLTDND